VRLFFSSRDPKKARGFAARYGAEAAGTWKEALKDSRIDGVVLSLPHDLHLRAAREAARAGKGILLEKPLARDAAEGRRLAQAVRGVPFLLGENYAFLPHLAPLLGAIRSGRIGKPLMAAAVARARLPITGWRLDARRMGGGCLVDMGVHYIRLLQTLFGPAMAVRTTRRAKPMRRMEGESEIETVLRFAGGLEARVDICWQAREGERMLFLRVDGEKGSLVLPFFEPRVILERAGSKKTLPVPSGDLRGGRALARAFVSVLRGGPSPVGCAEGVDDLRVVGAAYRSAETDGVWKRIVR